ncbi:hypothetical protein EIP86_011037 [Pleurotus ostreatoroseus]|nr:hypothetical protein EIP86_011037 [Pleurotus ostreatoroseus]
MIAQLSRLSQTAQPTAFHQLLRALDDRGRLLRVYTQNIDALECKSGLTFGVPELDVRRPKPRSTKGKIDQPEASMPSSSAASRLPTPPAETPRCIPLHGTLQSMHCQICLHSFPLENYLDDLNAGSFPICPECNQIEETRQAVGKRSRGVGKLRPSVVLYNEMHKDGEEVGEVVRRDLVGNSKGKGRAGADLLLVVGTSLRVPGTKRMVREFSKAVHVRSQPMHAEASTASTSSSSTSPLPSPRRTPTADEDAPIKTIYLNLDFPVPTREWEGVFDVWIRGDAQTFATIVQEEIEREEKAKEAAIERKRRREEMKEEAAREEERRREEAEMMAASQAKGKKTTKPQSKGPVSSSRKRKDAPGLPTPPRSAKKAKTLASLRKRPLRRTKSQPSATDLSLEKLTIRIPARPHAPRSAHRAYTPPTPPCSQRARLVPEVLITTTPRKTRTTGASDIAPDASQHLSSNVYFAGSPSLSTPPATPPRPTSPSTTYSDSGFSSPLTSILSSPISSPLSSPPLTPPLNSPMIPSTDPAHRRRRSTYSATVPAKPPTQLPYTHDEDIMVDIEGDADVLPRSDAFARMIRSQGPDTEPASLAPMN